MSNKNTTDRIETCQCGKSGRGYYPFFDTSDGLAIKYLCPECFEKVHILAKAIKEIVKIPERGIWINSFFRR